MLTLTYFSSATVAFTPDDLLELLTRSRARNRADGITGMLLYHQGHFVQVLEGAEPTVRATYDRISADQRHGSIELELEDTVAERTFGGWSMGFRNLAAASTEEIDGFTTFFNDMQAGRDVPGRTPAHMMLRAFSRPRDYRTAW